VSADRPGGRGLIALLSGVLLALPFLTVSLPPVTDLPQHLAQIRLLADALGNPDSPYRVQWLTPYSLVYAPLGLASLAGPPDRAARVAMIALAASWVLAVHGLAWRRARPAAAAVLGTALFLNHATYWGFLSFIAGWAAFALWLGLTTGRRPPRRPWSHGAAVLGAAILLYLSHALWLAAGLAWLVLHAVVFRPPRAVLLARLAGAAPAAVAIALWYPGLRAAGFTSPTRWFVDPTGRLSVSWLVDAALGGVHGPVEYAVGAAAAAWLAGGAWQHRAALAARADAELALAGGLLLGLALLLPDQYSNTIYFASRWLPAALGLLLLAVPPPRLPAPAATALTAAVLAGLVTATALTWRAHERREQAGLHAALAALPSAPRVIGLDYVKRSELIKGLPFLQAFAWAQVYRGGELNFSFAEFAPSPVVYRRPRPRPWTGGLEWYPERLQERDLAWFDFALVHGDAAIQAAFARLPGVLPVTGAGRWQLYRLPGARR
jgi:hypothetical protein